MMKCQIVLIQGLHIKKFHLNMQKLIQQQYIHSPKGKMQKKIDIIFPFTTVMRILDSYIT